MATAIPYTGFVAKTACPACAEGGKQVALQSNGSSGYRCANGHRYDDQEALRNDLARVKPGAIRGTPTALVLPGQCKVTVIVKEAVRDRLAQKFGERLEAVVAAHLAALCEDCLVFAGDDLKMLRDGVGEQRGNAFEVAARAKNLRGEVAVMAANSAGQQAEVTTGGPGVFQVKLSDAHTKQVQELARGRNMRAGEVLKQGIEWNLDSNNF